MAKADYYESLGVARDADAATLKKAYRKLAMQYHPDRNPGDAAAEERFKEISEAYGVLSDDDKRRVYDQYGHRGLEGAGHQGFSDFEDIFSSFGEMFGDLFGGGGGRRGGARVRRGADLRYDLELTFEEAAFGVEREVAFKRHEACETCDGSGAKPGTRPSTCGTCGGRGRVQRQQGFFMVQTVCPACRGAGVVITDPCDDCHGEGQTVVDRSVTVKVPPGVDDGMRLRVSGEGEPGPGGGPRGHLYVFLSVAQHDEFQRDGTDVHSEVAVTFSQAAMGDSLQVTTIHGEQTVKLPAGTQPGTMMRLRGKGIPRLQGSGRGDHFVTVRLDVPARLTRAQKKLMAELKEAGL